MRVIIEKSASDAANFVAETILELVENRPNAVLGLATGGTMTPVYERLLAASQNGRVSFQAVSTFNLDEYVGVKASSEHSYRYFMDKSFFESTDIDRCRTHLPDGCAEDLRAECEQYEGLIEQAGGIDLQLLGIGSDGHIGFNEPGSSLSSRTRVKTLTKQTRLDNSRFFAAPEDVPYSAITMGVGTIMDARQIVLLATGKNKAIAVRATVEGPLSAMVTASVLQWHPNALIVLDQDAASELENVADYLTAEKIQRELLSQHNK